MSDNTGIEWTRVPNDEGDGFKRGATWNVVTGCTKVSAGCKNCYAAREWARFCANPTAKKYFGRPFGDVRCHEDLLDQPLRWSKPRGVFVNAMGDLFHPQVPFAFIDRVFAVMASSPQHTFQILTKHAARMHEYMVGLSPDLERASAAFQGLGSLAAPPLLAGMRRWRAMSVSESRHGECGPLANVWLGVSAENQEMADARIPLLLQTPAAVRWVSAEPLIGPINLQQLRMQTGGQHIDALTGVTRGLYTNHQGAHIDWVVVGGESGPKARPMNPAWVRAVRDQCVGAGVPFFFKQWGEWLAGRVHADAAFVGGAFVDTQAPGVGRVAITEARDWQDGWASVRVPRKSAGRVLDGRTWEQWPPRLAQAA